MITAILYALEKFRFKLLIKPEHGKIRITVVSMATNESCSELIEVDGDNFYTVVGNLANKLDNKLFAPEE